MADVFISYAREDRDTAQRIANALETQRYTVWWDREILAGDQFDEVIERELDLAKSVIVLWSNSNETGAILLNDPSRGYYVRIRESAGWIELATAADGPWSLLHKIESSNQAG